MIEEPAGVLGPYLEEALRRIGHDCRRGLSNQVTAGLVAGFEAALRWHCAAFAAAGKRNEPAIVARALAIGEFAAGRRFDVNLWDDLALALLLQHRDGLATEAFRERFATRIAAWERRHSAGSALGWEEFLADLLLPRERSGPRVAAYAGHGPLDGWLKQVYISICHKRREGEAPHVRGRVTWGDEQDSEHEHSRFVARDEEPDDRFARLECAEKLRPLIDESLRALGDPDRTMLMMIVVDGVRQNQVAALFGLRDYEVARRKQRALRRVANTFFEAAKRIAKLCADEVRECLRLLLDRFPAA